MKEETKYCKTCQKDVPVSDFYVGSKTGKPHGRVCRPCCRTRPAFPPIESIAAEEWLPAPGYEGYYSVSNMGRVKAEARTVPHAKLGLQILQVRLLKPALRSGYPFLTLTKLNHRENCHVHRLVAKAFLAPIEGKNIVNHKDGVRTNNIYTNLEWCTYSENSQHRFSVLMQPGPMLGKGGEANHGNRKVLQLSMDGLLIASYYSLTKAFQETGISQQSIGKCASGQRNKAGNFKWQYAN